jgi:NAD(P)-dependent dehydrogenase (short-subunit alcohol dehydrogenase family)
VIPQANGKVAVVTGAHRGVGVEHIRSLAVGPGDAGEVTWGGPDRPVPGVAG